jgi:hypothetical protein
MMTKSKEINKATLVEIYKLSHFNGSSQVVAINIASAGM